MGKELQFFIYLLERYAESSGRSGTEVIKEWDDLELTEYIHGMYELYHIEALENAFMDIDQMVLKKKAEMAIA